MSELDFENFDRQAWTEYAWSVLDYPENDINLDSVRHGDADIEDLQVGRTVHVNDERFEDLADKELEELELDMDNPQHFLFEVYSLKDFIEVSPHPENTNVRILGGYLEQVYENFGIEPTGVKNGELIDRFEEEFEESF